MKEELLSDLILEFLVDSKFDSRCAEFLPEDQFQRLVTQSAIKKEFEGCEHDDKLDREALFRWIYQNARKIFAIMVHSGFNNNEALTTLQRLRANHFGDEHLPISKPNSKPERRRSIWKDERQGLRHRFYEKQWSFLAPVFSEYKFHYDLQPDVILPFITKYEEVGKGGFSRVYGFEVHPAHQYLGYSEVGIFSYLRFVRLHTDCYNRLQLRRSRSMGE
jgi:hypothetical protein